MDLIAAKLGANMAKADLAKNGQVGYVEIMETEIMPQTTLDFQPNDDMGGANVIILTEPFVPNDKYNYLVNWNGTKYSVRANVVDDGSAFFGNAALGGGEASNEPFYYVYAATEGLGLLLAKDPGEATVSIYETEEILHPIKDEYLPQTKTVKLTTAWTFGVATALNEVDSAIFESLAQEGCETVFVDDFGRLTAHSRDSAAAFSNVSVYCGFDTNGTPVAGQTATCISKQNGGWYVYTKGIDIV